VNHAGIYVELKDRGKLHFSTKDCLSEACMNKQICEETAELICTRLCDDAEDIRQ